MQLDEAVLKVLALDPETTTLTSAGGGGCSAASTLKITSRPKNGTKREYFMKTGKGEAAEVMFQGEHTSLSAVHNVVPTLCPQSFGWGKFSSDTSTFFLVTDFLNLGARTSISTKTSLASKLAKLHTTMAPIPEGHDKPMFGFPVTTCCGDTPQDNSYKASWADFYANNRLRHILKKAEARNSKDGEFSRMVESVASKVVPKLIGDDHLNRGEGIVPVVIHGDLWSGNASTGSFGESKEIQEVVYDSSACYAHSEFELGIMKMFGGFGEPFLVEYHRYVPKTKPEDEYEDRVALYELYHHLNHYALFGGSYKSGASSIMKKLIRKYVHDQA